MVAQDRLNSIDFIKGFAALSVILLHTLPSKVLLFTGAVYHIWQAVPLFFLITFYLGFKSLEKHGTIKAYYSLDRVRKLFFRLWLPYLILASLQTLLFYIKEGRIDYMKLFCINNGPGSYYIWCYMQIWILLPLLFYILKRFGIVSGGCFIFVLSFVGDFLWERYGLDWPGICCARYLFLSVVAYLYLKGIELKRIKILILLSVVFLAYMTIHEFYNVLPKWADPFFPDGWERQTSFGFFYTLFFFIVLSKFYNKIKGTTIASHIIFCGRCSWEIFMAQLFLLGSGLSRVINSLITNSFVRVVIVIVSTAILSIGFALVYDNCIKKKNSLL